LHCGKEIAETNNICLWRGRRQVLCRQCSRCCMRLNFAKSVEA